MTFTVKQVSALSGVSIRTLHFYDEIDLVKPAYCGTNHYRYYEREQLLLLQQVLFFRELGFELQAIKNIIHASHFNKLSMLKIQRTILENNLKHTQNLLETLNQTIDHLEKDETMQTSALFKSFKEEFILRVQYYIEFLRHENLINQKQEQELTTHLKNWKDSDWDKIKNESTAIHLNLAALIGSDIKSDAVQKIIKQHYEMIQLFFTPCPDVANKKMYIGLAELYTSKLKSEFDRFHPQLANFLADAMKYFAQSLTVTDDLRSENIIRPLT